MRDRRRAAVATWLAMVLSLAWALIGPAGLLPAASAAGGAAISCTGELVSANALAKLPGGTNNGFDSEQAFVQPPTCSENISAPVQSPDASSTSATVGSATATGSAQVTTSTAIDPSSGALTLTASGTATGTGILQFDPAKVPNPSADVAADGGGRALVTFTLTLPSATTYTADASANVVLTGGVAGTDRYFQATVTPAIAGETGFFGGGGTQGTMPVPALHQTGTLPAGTYTIQLDMGLAVDAPATPSVTANGSVNGSFTLRLSSASSCTGRTSLKIGLALAAGCFHERMTTGGAPTGVFETTDPAWLGGFDLEPGKGGKLVFTPASLSDPVRATGAGADWVLTAGGKSVPAPLSLLKPFDPSFPLQINSSGTFDRFLSLPLLKVAGGVSAQMTVTWATGGAGSKLEGQVSIEDLTKNLGRAILGNSIGTLSGTLTLQLQNGTTIDLTKADLQMPEYALELKDTTPPLKMGFGGARFKAQLVSNQLQWSAEASLAFPFEKRQGKLTGRVFYTDQVLGGYGLSVSGLDDDIGDTGWVLTGVDANVIARPDIAYDFGVTAQSGPNDQTNQIPLMKLTGNLKGLRLAQNDCKNGTNPFEFVGTGNLPPLEAVKVGQAQLQLLMCAYVPSAQDFAFEVGLSGQMTLNIGSIAKAVSASGSASGWFHGTPTAGDPFLTAFNIEGTFQLQLPVVGSLTGHGLLSSEGYAFCATIGHISAGFASSNWLEAPESIIACDFTPYRAPLPSRPHGVAARAAAPLAVTVPPGQLGFSIAVHAAAGQPAPRVRITGPRGETFVTPATATALETSAAVILPFDDQAVTLVFLHQPRAGVWTITPLAGSSAVTALRTATELPPPHVSGSIGVHGQVATLRWRSAAAAGRRIELVDRAAGVAQILQQPSTRTRGRIRFRIASPLDLRRSIEAVVFNRAIPVADATVLHYRIRTPRRPGAVPAATARRTRSGIALRWTRAPSAVRYVVTVSVGTAVIARVETASRHLVFRGLPRGHLVIRIAGLDQFGRTGRARRLAVKS
jgi:hypothetical protein